jgi:hypothetical protein
LLSSGLSVECHFMVGSRPQLVVVSGLSVGCPFTVGSRLSRSPWLSRSLFSKFLLYFWDFGYQEALSRKFLFLIMEFSAITKPFTRLLFHTLYFSAITEPFTNFSFTLWNFGYHGAFHKLFFHTMEFLKTHDLGESSFHICHKEYYIGSASLKTLPLDLGPPLQGKRVLSFLF